MGDSMHTPPDSNEPAESVESVTGPVGSVPPAAVFDTVVVHDVATPAMTDPGEHDTTVEVAVPVPASFHSSAPWAPSSALKSSVPFSSVNCAGIELPA